MGKDGEVDSILWLNKSPKTFNLYWQLLKYMQNHDLLRTAAKSASGGRNATAAKKG